MADAPVVVAVNGSTASGRALDWAADDARRVLRDSIEHWDRWGFGAWTVMVRCRLRRLHCRPCRRVTVEAVPFARYRSGFVRDFEDLVAWLDQVIDSLGLEVLHLLGYSEGGWIAGLAGRGGIAQPGADPGELFTVRNMGAFVPPFEGDAGYHGTSAAIEFATLVLGASYFVKYAFENEWVTPLMRVLLGAGAGLALSHARHSSV